MRPYLAVFSARFRVLLQYRAAALAGFATQLFWGLIRIMAFEAFYRSSTVPQPMTYEEVVVYVWLSQAMIGLMPWNTDREVRDLIRSGTVAYELLRPVDLYTYWFTRALALRVAPTLLRSIPLLIVSFLFFGMRFPPTLDCGLAWAVATLMALLVSAAFTVVLNLSVLWTLSGDGVVQIASSFIWMLSGMIIPLPLFPDWAQPIVNVLPFRALMDAPFRLYMGHIPLDQVWGALAHQAFWLILLIGVGRWLMTRGLRRVVVQGG